MSAKKIQLIFVFLQFGDVVTTLAALRLGGFEQNTLVSHLMIVGPLQGLLLSKMIILAVAAIAAIGRRYRTLRWGNVAYSGVVLWNLFIIAMLTSQTHRG
jgi:hypothetical protein